jgi:hypothetical protein
VEFALPLWSASLWLCILLSLKDKFKMTLKEKFGALLLGKKLFRKKWSATKYVYMDKNGTLVDDTGSPSYSNLTDEEWEIYEDSQDLNLEIQTTLDEAIHFLHVLTPKQIGQTNLMRHIQELIQLEIKKAQL